MTTAPDPISRLLELCERATPGPWQCDTDGYVEYQVYQLVPLVSGFKEGATDGDPQAVTNAHLIALAPALRQAGELARASRDFLAAGDLAVVDDSVSTGVWFHDSQAELRECLAAFLAVLSEHFPQVDEDV